MKILQGFAAVAVLAAPLLLATAPAQALTSHQYQAQGHGMYVSSKARGGYGMYHRYHRHHYFHRHY